MSGPFRPYEYLVKITLMGKTIKVPDRNSVLRCFRFLVGNHSLRPLLLEQDANTATVPETDTSFRSWPGLKRRSHTSGSRRFSPTAKTARLMHSRQFENHPRLNAMALGFYEETRNGHRIIGHGGDTVCFHSDLHLMQDAALGFFISYNSAGKGEISPRSAVWNEFLDRYFPYTPPPATAVVNAEDARLVSGDYITSRRSQTSILSVGTVLGELKVSQNSDGTISADAFKEMNGEPRHFREMAPLVFRDVNGQSLLAFKRDESGQLVMAIDFPFMVFQKARWYNGSLFNMTILIGALTMLSLTLLLWPVAALVRWHYGRRLDLSSTERGWRRWVRLVCAVDLAFVLAFVGAIAGGLSNPAKLNRGLDPMLRVVQLVGWLGVAGTLLPLYNHFRAWRNRESLVVVEAARFRNRAGVPGLCMVRAVLEHAALEPDLLSSARAGFVVAFCYLAIVLALWLPFGPHSGLPYETGFVYTSEISTWWNGFVHGADHLRFYTSLFYQVAYLMGELSGFGGSFVPYQIVYAALWWARGFLVFLIGRRLTPGYDLFWYLAGALVLVHSSDDAAGWVGLLNQSGYTFWMPLAFYMLVAAFQQINRQRVLACVLLAVFFEHLSLWSYESQIVILLAAPLLLARFVRPAVAAVDRRSLPHGTLSRPSTLWRRSGNMRIRSDTPTSNRCCENPGRIGQMLSDWLFNMSASVRFWAWAGTQPSHADAGQLAAPAALAVVAFLCGIALVAWISGTRIPTRRTLWTVMLVGAALLALSFPAYLILESARSFVANADSVGLRRFAGAERRSLLVCELDSRKSEATCRDRSAGRVRGGVRKFLGAEERGVSLVDLGAPARCNGAGASRRSSSAAGHLDDNDRRAQRSRSVSWRRNVVRHGAAAGLSGRSGGRGVFLPRWDNRGGRPSRRHSGREMEAAQSAGRRRRRWSDAGRGSTGRTVLLLIARGVPRFLGVDEKSASPYNPSARIVNAAPSFRAIRRYGPLD